MTNPGPRLCRSEQATPEQAWNAVLAGRTVRVVVGSDPEDPVCLMYLDRCYEDDFEPMIFTESVGGWSEGVKECVCEPDNDFFVRWLSAPAPENIVITDDEPPQREASGPVAIEPSER